MSLVTLAYLGHESFNIFSILITVIVSIITHICSAHFANDSNRLNSDLLDLCKHLTLIKQGLDASGDELKTVYKGLRDTNEKLFKRQDALEPKIHKKQ